MEDDHILRHAYVHFVWATTRRLPLLTEDIEASVYRYIAAICKNDKCDLLAIGGMPDHLHLLVRLSTTISISDFLRHIKGGSSRLISKELKPGSWFAWQRGYAVFTIPLLEVDRVVTYIHRQKHHHTIGKPWPSLETMAPDENPSPTELPDAPE